jgi:hypothetical protein
VTHRIDGPDGADPESGEPTPRTAPIAWGRGLLARTGVAIRGAVGRRDGRASLLVVAALYLLTYLWALRDLTATGSGGIDVFVVAEPVSTALTPLSPFLFEAVARIEAGPIVYLFRPVNVALGLGLGLLVGVTLSVSVVSWRGPEACRIGAGAGATAGVPGLLSGVACCGPQLLVVVGLQASAGLVAAMQWMVPLAVASLLLTLVWVGSRVRLPE